jgi:hypothetical protein
MINWEVADFGEEGGGGVAGDDIDAGYTAAVGFNFGATDDLIVGPVAAFDQNVWEKGGDHFLWGGLGEDEDGVHAFEAGENFGAFEFRDDGAMGPFKGADAGVTVDADDEDVSESAGGFEAADVAGMKKIEAAVREDNSTGVAFLFGKPENRLVEG